MLPYFRLFDQRTLSLLMEHDAIVQRYRALFALLDRQVLPDPVPDASRPGKLAHPESAYIKALLIKINEGYGSGIATATTPDYGDGWPAEFTQPFNESDVSSQI